MQTYLLKGTQIAIVAKAVQERWEKDGVKRSKVVFEISDIQLLGGKKETGQPKPAEKQQYEKAVAPKQESFNEGDIPF